MFACLSFWMSDCIISPCVFSVVLDTGLVKRGRRQQQKSDTGKCFCFYSFPPVWDFFITAAACLELLFEIFYILKQKKKKTKKKKETQPHLYVWYPPCVSPNFIQMCLSRFRHSLWFSFEIFFFFCIRLLSQSINNFSLMPSAFV